MRFAFFDLDGVLVDSRPGIVASVARTIEFLGLSRPSDARIEAIIGPPLEVGFAELLAEVGANSRFVDECVLRYRELYAEVATTATHLQPGIRELLETLGKHARLAVATSKSMRFSDPILTTLGIRDAFDVVAAPGARPAVESKTITLRRAWDEMVHRHGSVSAGSKWMIGDRKFDIEAAIDLGMGAIGVTWGFGREAELREAGAHAIVRVPNELVGVILGDL